MNYRAETEPAPIETEQVNTGIFDRVGETHAEVLLDGNPETRFLILNHLLDHPNLNYEGAPIKMISLVSEGKCISWIEKDEDAPQDRIEKEEQKCPIPGKTNSNET